MVFTQQLLFSLPHSHGQVRQRSLLVSPGWLQSLTLLTWRGSAQLVSFTLAQLAWRDSPHILPPLTHLNLLSWPVSLQLLPHALLVILSRPGSPHLLPPLTHPTRMESSSLSEVAVQRARRSPRGRTLTTAPLMSLWTSFSSLSPTIIMSCPRNASIIARLFTLITNQVWGAKIWLVWMDVFWRDVGGRGARLASQVQGLIAEEIRQRRVVERLRGERVLYGGQSCAPSGTIAAVVHRKIQLFVEW